VTRGTKIIKVGKRQRVKGLASSRFNDDGKEKWFKQKKNIGLVGPKKVGGLPSESRQREVEGGESGTHLRKRARVSAQARRPSKRT